MHRKRKRKKSKNKHISSNTLQNIAISRVFKVSGPSFKSPVLNVNLLLKIIPFPLTHIRPMLPFYSPWKRQKKPLWFTDDFKWDWKGKMTR